MSDTGTSSDASQRNNMQGDDQRTDQDNGRSSSGDGSSGNRRAPSRRNSSSRPSGLDDANRDATAPLQTPGCPKVIDATAHGLIDYAFSAVCLLAPSLLRLKGPSATVCHAVGLSTLAINAFSDTPVGLRKTMSFQQHARCELPVLPVVAAATVMARPKRAKGLFLTLLLAGLTNYMLTDYTTGGPGTLRGAEDDAEGDASTQRQRPGSGSRRNQPSGAAPSRRQRNQSSTPGRTAHVSGDPARETARTGDNAATTGGADASS
jgi:hypothetical protein